MEAPSTYGRFTSNKLTCLFLEPWHIRREPYFLNRELLHNTVAYFCIKCTCLSCVYDCIVFYLCNITTCVYIVAAVCFICHYCRLRLLSAYAPLNNECAILIEWSHSHPKQHRPLFHSCELVTIEMDPVSNTDSQKLRRIKLFTRV